MKKLVSSIIYSSWILVLLYCCLLQSRRARNRYSSRDLLTKSGRDNSDEGLNYFLFEKIYLQVPLLFLQLLCQFLFPKRCRFDFMAIGTIIILVVLVQFRTVVLIASWSLVFFLFQAEEKRLRAIAAILSISFTGYLKYRLDEFHLDVTDLQLLLAASFKSIACLCTDELTEASKMDFLSYYFYPSTITGPWISFSNFLKTKREEKNNDQPSLSCFFGDVAKWIAVMLILEAVASWFYTSLLIRDVSLIEHCPWLSLMALVTVITFKTWAELYFCYGLNYAVIKLDGMDYKPPRAVWLDDGFRQVWRTYDHGQHEILKENIYKPILREGGNEIIAAFCSFMIVAFWHSPLPYYNDNHSNWNSILAFFVFGFGNFFFTVAETISSRSKIHKAWKAFAFIAIYPVNIYFICSNFQLGNIIISRLFLNWNIIPAVMVGSFAVHALEKKRTTKDLV